MEWYLHKSRSDDEADSRWASDGPWSNDFQEAWGTDGVYLGMSETSALEKANEQQVVFQGGFVRGIRNPDRAVHLASSGHHPLGTDLEVGQRPSSDILEFNPDWDRKLKPHPHARIEYDGDVVTSIDLYVPDDELFEALEAFER